MAGPHPSQPSRRRSGRFPVVVAIDVAWQQPDGSRIQERAEASEVNSHGGLLQMGSYPPMGTEVSMTNTLDGSTCGARVVAVRRSADGHTLGVAVELEKPSETFWGINYQLKKTTSDLMKLGNDIREGSTDLRALRDFRDAVDYVRKAAWVVYEWQERQQKGHDTQTVLTLLIIERIRRATQMNSDLSENIQMREVDWQTPGVPELKQGIARLLERLQGLEPAPKQPKR